jgi:hypothetical protein
MLVGTSIGAVTSNARNAVASAPNNIVNVEMHNIVYHFTHDIAVHIGSLRGELVPAGNNAIPVFDDKNSFTLRIAQGEIAISADSMARVLNTHVFSRADSPLKDISIRINKDELNVKGKLHSKGNIPFEMDGVAAATRTGQIRIHPKTIKALHLPVKGLMDLFGIEVANLIKTDKIPGVRTEGDDLILDPQRILPPPHIQGKVTEVHLEGDQIVQFFGDRSKLKVSRTDENYMQYEGNRLRFGKLTMSDTDLVLLDLDPQDPFDFYLDHYRDQLVAGYTKTTPSFGLRVYMRDYNKLIHPHTQRQSTANPVRR